MITALAGPIVPNLYVLARVSLPELLQREANSAVGSGDVPDADRILDVFEGNRTRRRKWMLELAVRTEEIVQQKKQAALIGRVVEALLVKPTLSREDLHALS